MPDLGRPMTPQEAQSIIEAGEPCPYDPYDWELYEEARRMLRRIADPCPEGSDARWVK